MKPLRIGTVLIEDSPGETRAAALAGGRVWHVDHYRDIAPEHRGAVFLGRVRHVDRGANAALVDLGGGLGLGADPALLRCRDAATGGRAGRRPRIESFVHEGMALIVQVSAEARSDDGKGPRVTAGVALTGRFLILRPAGPAGLDAGENASKSARARLQALLAPGEGGAALAGAEAAADAALGEDIAQLRARWRDIEARARAAVAPALLAPAPDGVARALHMFARDGVSEIIADSPRMVAAARSWCARFRPALAERVRQAAHGARLFEEFGVEEAIEAALEAEVALPGGGRLVFEPGRTLTAIDIDGGGRMARGGQAACETNLAAAPEIHRQIRLRAIGGAIVVDALKMQRSEDQRAVVRAFRTAAAGDPWPCHVLGMSRLGLVEMTRARLGPTLAERLLETVQPRRASPLAAAYAALRRIQRAAAARPAPCYVVHGPAAVISALTGPLAEARGEVEAGLGGALRLHAREGMAIDSLDVIPARPGGRADGETGSGE